MKSEITPIHLIREIGHLQLTMADTDAEKRAKDFLETYSDDLIGFLEELSDRRNAEESGISPQNTHRVIVEGFSAKEASDAFSDALAKAGHYFSSEHDVSVTLQRLTELPQGGFHAIMEVHMTPLTLRERYDVVDADVELKRIHDHHYRQDRRHEQEALKHLIFDHFTSKSGGVQLPDHFLINVQDAHLLEYMIEKQFFEKGHAPLPGKHIIIRKRDHDGG